MKAFMDADFCLSTPTAARLYHRYAETLPILDYHCHLIAKEIYENKPPENISRMWLQYDHYKWRQMRANGVPEELITGAGSDKDKFLAFAATLPYAAGNPLYHWTHLELQRYFGIREPLGPATAEQIWEQTSRKIAAGGYTPRELIERSNVYALVTTEDPADDLQYHRLLTQDPTFHPIIVPAYRPDKALNISAPGWTAYLDRLSAVSGVRIDSLAALKRALLVRMDAFAAAGCVISDHGVERMPFAPADEQTVASLFDRALRGGRLTEWETDQYVTELLSWLAAEYHRRGWGMELHIGPLRSANTRAARTVGPDSGFDSISDHSVAAPLRAFMDRLEQACCLPKMVLFCINNKDNMVLVNLAGSFQGDGIPGKIQFGTAWWMQDHRDGMVEQMRVLASEGLLGRFIGMLTDSRSFLSYPRHEYFRRIFCDLLGGWVENGEFPADEPTLEMLVRGVCFDNVKAYLNL